MSPVLTDELLATELRAALDDVRPPLALDPAAVLRAGRAHRARRAVGGGAIATLTVAAFAVGALQLFSATPEGVGPASSAAPAQQPRAFGESPVVELLPGVLAVNRPEAVVLPDGSEVLDLGIETRNLAEVGGTEWRLLPTILAPAAATNLVAEGEFMPGIDIDTGVTLRTLVDGEIGPFAGPTVAWSSSDSARLYHPADERPAYIAGAGGMAWDGTATSLHLGAVPSWLPEPRVILFSERGYLDSDGNRVPSIELPTFRAPTPDGRLLYAALVGPEQRFSASPESDDAVDLILFLGSDGQVQLAGGCTSTLQQCAATLGPELYTVAGVAAPDLSRGEIAVDQATTLSPVPPQGRARQFQLDLQVLQGVHSPAAGEFAPLSLTLDGRGVARSADHGAGWDEAMRIHANGPRGWSTSGHLLTVGWPRDADAAALDKSGAYPAARAVATTPFELVVAGVLPRWLDISEVRFVVESENGTGSTRVLQPLGVPDAPGVEFVAAVVRAEPWRPGLTATLEFEAVDGTVIAEQIYPGVLPEP